MKKVISIIVILTITVQLIGLYLYFYDKLSMYPVKLVDIVWISSASLAIIFGIIYFILNRGMKIPSTTVMSVALLGIIGFQVMLSKNLLVVLFLIILTFVLHLYTYKESKFSIFPIISSIMGIYSFALYFCVKLIASM